MEPSPGSQRQGYPEREFDPRVMVMHLKQQDDQKMRASLLEYTDPRLKPRRSGEPAGSIIRSGHKRHHSPHSKAHQQNDVGGWTRSRDELQRDAGLQHSSRHHHHHGAVVPSRGHRGRPAAGGTAELPAHDATTTATVVGEASPTTAADPGQLDVGNSRRRSSPEAGSSDDGDAMGYKFQQSMNRITNSMSGLALWVVILLCAGSCIYRRTFRCLLQWISEVTASQSEAGVPTLAAVELQSKPGAIDQLLLERERAT